MLNPPASLARSAQRVQPRETFSRSSSEVRTGPPFFSVAYFIAPQKRAPVVPQRGVFFFCLFVCFLGVTHPHARLAPFLVPLFGPLPPKPHGASAWGLPSCARMSSKLMLVPARSEVLPARRVARRGRRVGWGVRRGGKAAPEATQNGPPVERLE